jgi:hypothetical protein
MPLQLQQHLILRCTCLCDAFAAPATDIMRRAPVDWIYLSFSLRAPLVAWILIAWRLRKPQIFRFTPTPLLHL